MSSKRKEQRESAIFRARVRQLIAAGYSNARIAKETGKSPKHVALIVAQEKAA